MCNISPLSCFTCPDKDPKTTPTSLTDHTLSPQATPTSKTSPPPVTYEPSPAIFTTQNSSNSVSSPTTANGETPGEMMTSPVAGTSTRSDSVSSDIVYFAPTIGGDSRVPATGDGVRDRCRELLSKSMMKGFDKGEGGAVSSTEIN